MVGGGPRYFADIGRPVFCEMRISFLRLDIEDVATKSDLVQNRTYSFPG